MIKDILKVLRFLGKLCIAAGTILSLLLAGLFTALYFSIEWMFDTWNNLSMNELVFHLTAPLDGTNQDVIREYINICLSPAAVVLLAMLTAFAGFKGTKKYYVVMLIGVAVPAYFGVSGFEEAWTKLDAGNYVESQGEDSDFIEKYYVNPRDTEIAFPEQKRNLIYIFLESMEVTYADKTLGGAFNDNIIPELTAIAKENEDFSGEDTESINGGYSLNGSTWTMGAIFSQTAGIPLNISIGRNNMDTQDTFFDGIITLGDILESAGYSQSFMIGSDAEFGGRELYFKKHGNFDIFDYSYAEGGGLIPEGYRVWWGYEDERLFSFAKQRILEMAEGEQPFNFTMLTVDTHFEDGWLCGRCPDTYGEDQYANVMACSSAQVAEFLRWIQSQDFYENTTVVICGDHPTMDSDFCENVEESYDRKVYTAFINSVAEKRQTQSRIYSTFDMFPTTLAAMGVEISGDRLGLGTNLFSDRPTRTEEIGVEDEDREVAKKSEFLTELAKLDEEDNLLLVRKGTGPRVNLDASSYDYYNGKIYVTASEFQNIDKEIASVQLAVWTVQDQSDLQWVGMYQRDDGSYYGEVETAGFGYKPGQYNMQAYIFDTAGKTYLAGGAQTMVE
ncbi:MAG: sulfatase-like hydrolase/transferase [Dorea sp.]|nr:sulfatase-like hydrolase/transferase [Dorea sp.]